MTEPDFDDDYIRITNAFQDIPVEAGHHPPPRLYHYTKKAGIEGIIGNKVLRATNLFDLGDQHEMWAAPMFLGVLRPLRSQFNDQTIHCLIARLSNCVANLDLDAFTSCFCGTHPEWQAPNPARGAWDGLGDYCLELCTDGLIADCKFVVVPVGYDLNKQCDKVAQELRDLLTRAQNCIAMGEFSLPQSDVVELLAGEILMRSRHLVTVKRPTYSFESEWRMPIVIQGARRRAQYPVLKDYEKGRRYIEHPLSPTAIKRAFVRPNAPMSVSDVQALLHTCGCNAPVVVSVDRPDL